MNHPGNNHQWGGISLRTEQLTFNVIITSLIHQNDSVSTRDNGVMIVIYKSKNTILKDAKFSISLSVCIYVEIVFNVAICRNVRQTCGDYLLANTYSMKLRLFCDSWYYTSFMIGTMFSGPFLDTAFTVSNVLSQNRWFLCDLLCITLRIAHCSYEGMPVWVLVN